MHDTTESRISVITVNLNNRSGLERTIRSVISQQNVSVEHIIIDGGSNDGSQEVVRGFASHIAAWVSEPDQGPYDAMNKGIGLSTGAWINFLNAGDIFYSPDSLSGIMPYLDHGGNHAIYGDSLADYGNFRVYRKALPLACLWKGMVFSHQALFVKASLLKEERFDTRYSRIADYDLVLRILHDHRQVYYEPLPLVICDAYGISNKGQASILLEYCRRAKQSLDLDFAKKSYYIKMFLWLSLIDLLKMLLPKRLFNAMIRILRKNLIS